MKKIYCIHCKDDPYGNAYISNLCAYNENMEEYELCPYIMKNWENIIDELTKEDNKNA